MSKREKVQLEIDASIANERGFKATLKEIENSFSKIEASIQKNKSILESSSRNQKQREQSQKRLKQDQQKMTDLAKRRLKYEQQIVAEYQKQAKLQRQMQSATGADSSGTGKAKKSKSSYLGSMFDSGVSYAKAMVPIQIFNKLTQAIMSTAKAVIEMNKQLTQLDALSSMSNKEMAVTAKTIYDVSNQYGIMTNVVANAAIEMVKMGASTEETNNILRASGGIAKATGESFVFVASTIKKTMNQFKFQADQATEIADKLGYAVSNSAGGIKTFATALEYAGSTAQSVGVSFDNLIAQTMTLADGGMSASRIGTSLRKIYTEISATGKGVSSEFERLMKMNLSYAEAIDKFGIRAAGAWKMMSNDMSKVNDMQKQLTIKSLGSANAMGLIASSNTDTKLKKVQLNFEQGFGLAQQGVSADSYVGQFNNLSKAEIAAIADQGLRSGSDAESKAYIDAISNGDSNASAAILRKRAAMLDTKLVATGTSASGGFAGAIGTTKYSKRGTEDAYRDVAETITRQNNKEMFLRTEKATLRKQTAAIGDKYKVKFAEKGFRSASSYQDGMDRSSEIFNSMTDEMRAYLLANSDFMLVQGKDGKPTKASMKDRDSFINSVISSFGAEYAVGNIMSGDEAVSFYGQETRKAKAIKANSGRSLTQNAEMFKAEKRASDIKEAWNLDTKKKKTKAYKPEEIISRQGVKGTRLQESQDLNKITEMVNYSKNRTKEFKNEIKREAGEDDYQYAARYNNALQSYNADMSEARAFLDPNNLEEVTATYVDNSIGQVQGLMSANDMMYKEQSDKLKSDFEGGKMNEAEYNKRRATMLDRQSKTRGYNIEKINTIQRKGDEILQTGLFASQKYGTESNKTKSVDTIAGSLFGEDGGDVLDIGRQIAGLTSTVSSATSNILSSRMQMLQEEADREIELERQKYETISELNKSSYENQTMNAEQYAQAQYEAKKKQVDAENEIAEEVFERQQAADKINATANYTASLAQMAIAVLASPKAAMPAVTAGIIAANTAMMTASYASQMSAIGQREYTPVKYAQGGMVYGASHANGGVPFSVNGRGGYEMEGGEFVVNKASTSKNLPLLNAINQGDLHTINMNGGSTQAQLEMLQEINNSLKAPVRAYVSSQDLEKNEEHRKYVKQKASY